MKIIKTTIRYIYSHSIVRFLTVGVTGLLSDVSVLYALRHVIGLIPAKIVSYIIALTVTWFFNRCFTFHTQHNKGLQEWIRYGTIYAVTGVLHVLLFAFLTHQYHQLYQHPVWALLITAVVIAFFNYYFSRRFAFNVVSI